MQRNGDPKVKDTNQLFILKLLTFARFSMEYHDSLDIYWKLSTASTFHPCFDSTKIEPLDSLLSQNNTFESHPRMLITKLEI